MPDTANDWSSLVEQWTVDVPAPTLDAVRAHIEAERRRMMIGVAADVFVTLVFVAGIFVALARYPGSWTRLLAIDVAAMLLATWAFALWNRRGAWRPLGESTEEFLRLARLRCRRKLQAVRFGIAVLAAQLLAVAAWLAWGPASPFERGGAVTVLPLAVVVVFVTVLSRTRARIRRELALLDRLAE